MNDCKINHKSSHSYSYSCSYSIIPTKPEWFVEIFFKHWKIENWSSGNLDKLNKSALNWNVNWRNGGKERKRKRKRKKTWVQAWKQVAFANVEKERVSWTFLLTACDASSSVERMDWSCCSWSGIECNFLKLSRVQILIDSISSLSISVGMVVIYFEWNFGELNVIWMWWNWIELK